MNGTLHHVGFVVAHIDAVAANMALSIGATWNASIVHDPIQQVSVTFLEPAAPGGVRFELVEPVGESSRAARFLEQGGGLHHVCYEVDDIQAQLVEMRASKAVVLRSPQPAAAFGGRRIAWVWTREKLLVEYLERAGVEG